MTVQWNKERNDRLIELFLENECLWDTDFGLKFDGISLKVLQGQAYKRIGFQLNIKPDDVKAKLYNIKCAYGREKKNVLKMQETGKHYKPGLYYYDKLDMHLGNSYMKRNTGIFNTKGECKQNKSETQNTGTKQEIKLNKPEIQNKKPTLKCHHTTVSENPTEKVVTSFEKMPNQLSIFQPDKAFLNAEFEIFGNSLAKELKELPLEHALKLHLELQSIITDHRLSMIKGKGDLLHSKPGPSGLSNKRINTICFDEISQVDTARSEDFIVKTGKNVNYPTINDAIHNKFDEFDVNKDVNIKVMISEPCESDDDI